MNRILGKIAGVTVLALALAFTAAAQQQGEQEKPPPPPPPGKFGLPGTAPDVVAAPMPTPEEEAAYKEFVAATEVRPVNASRVVQLGEDFVGKFPKSAYNGTVYASLAGAYQSTNNAAKMLEAGEKALEFTPDNIDALSLMAWAIPRGITGQEPDVMERLERSAKYAQLGIEILNGLEKPATISDEDFARSKSAKLSMCHSGLGLVYFHTQRFADSVTQLEQATQVTSDPDPVDFYLLGMAYQNAQRPHEAVTAYEKCTTMKPPGQILGACRQLLAEVKKVAATTLKPPTP